MLLLLFDDGIITQFYFYIYSFAIYEAGINRKINVLLHGKKLNSFVVNPYHVPSQEKTHNIFIKQLKKEPMLAVLAEEVPIDGANKYEDEKHMTHRLYEIVGGERTEEKKGILEDCLFQFRKVFINKTVSFRKQMQSTFLDDPTAMYRVDPVIVEVMYLRLFLELNKNGIYYYHRDFGIVSNEDFLFDKVYREDHPDLFPGM